MIKRFAFALFLFSFVSGAAFGWQWDVQAPKTDQKGNFDTWQINKRLSGSFGVWQADLYGDLNVEGLNIDLEDNGSFDDRSAPNFHLGYTLSRRSRLALDYAVVRHQGTVTKAVTFDSNNYNAGAILTLRHVWFDLCGARMLKVFGDPAKVKVDPSHVEFLYGVKFDNAHLRVSGRDATNTAIGGSWGELLPIPYIGLAGRARFTDTFGLHGSFKYISANVGDNSARSYDYALDLQWRINPLTTSEQWFLTAGYRGFMVDGESETNSIKVGYTGPVFGLIGRF